MRRTILILLGVGAVLSGCGDDATSSGASTGDGDTSGSTSAAGGGNTGGSGSGGDASTTGTGGADASLHEIDVTQTPCFELATGNANADNPCVSGDLYFLTGANVDLSAEGSGGYCVKPGTFTTLDAVPSDYAGCNFETYVEGGDPLDNTGYVVQDRADAHRYKMQIVENGLPTLTFRYTQID